MHCNSQNPGRRHFLKVASVGTVSLLAGGLLESARAEQPAKTPHTDPAKSPAANTLELLFLGTGAANWPSKYPFKDKNHPRAEVRAFSSMLVNGKILIDCGPTVLDVMNCFEVKPTEVSDILLTHTHPDHLHLGNIMSIANARDAGHGPLRLWGDPEALKKVPDSDRIEKRPVEVGKSFQVHGLTMTGLAANHSVHGSNEQCLLYLIESATKRAFYATDTGWLPTSTWLHIQRKQLDAIIWDTTVGEGKGDSRVFSHNDLSMIRHMNESLIKGKALKPDAKIILTHIADKLHPPHDVLEKKLLPEGLIPAYEGMSVALKNS